jgi:hypothetical protein
VVWPVVVLGEGLFAVLVFELLFHGAHMNRAPMIRTAATIAMIIPEFVPARFMPARSSGPVRRLRSSCIVKSP